ncbi:MAG: hypothetical protein GY869_20455, partial [Planctomycetes bacterium]|nr:hypothetical protein [Planctomycetota bacterium]
PEMKNSTITDAAFTIRAMPPGFNPSGGRYDSAIAVTLSTGTDDAVIRYTTDGGDPDKNSTEYTKPIILTRTTNLKARAFKEGMDSSDASGAIYTITTGKKRTLTLTSPNGGETLERGKTHLITWASTGDIDIVRLEYSSGGSWEVIAALTENDSSYSWTVAEVISSSVKVRISTVAGYIYDTSDEVFAIVSPPLEDELVAYYPFNGNANDESGNGNNGTVNGASLTKDRFGSADRAYGFDGADDYIDFEILDAVDISRPLSIGCFLNAGSLPASGTNAIIHHQKSNDNRFGVGLNSSGEIATGFYNNDSWVGNSSGEITINTWNHIVFVFDG